MKLVLATCLLLGLCGPAWAQEGPALAAFRERSRQGQVDPSFATQVLERARVLEEQGLPSEPYLLKVNEGLAKRVPPPRMSPALEATVERTRSAAALADEAVQRGATASPEIRRAAILRLQSELMSGRTREDLEKVIQSGLEPGRRPNLADLAEEAARGRARKRDKGKSPALKAEKPGQAVSPAKSRVQKIEKGSGKGRGRWEAPGRSKPDSPFPKHQNSKGKQGGKGHGK